MLSAFQNIIVPVIVFALMIFVHELGHFAAAKSFGIRVNEFALGMGPAVFKKKGKETLYSLRILPVGGFCKMEGEDAHSDDAAAFGNAARWKRFIVLVAGAVLNIVLGFAIFIVIKGGGSAVTQPVIDQFTPGTHMVDSVFAPGDKIIKLNDTDIHIFEDVSFFMERASDAPVTVTVKRGGERITSVLLPSKCELKYTYYADRVEAETVIEGKSQGMESVPIDKPELYKDRIGQSGVQTSYVLGFSATRAAPTFVSTVHDAFFRTIFDIKRVYVSLYELVTGRVPASQISGPIGIISMIGTASKINWIMLFELVALLTVNLGVMNLLPLPALDGGQILFVLAESIARKDIAAERKGLINLIGFGILFALIIFATCNDILRLIGGWT